MKTSKRQTILYKRYTLPVQVKKYDALLMKSKLQQTVQQVMETKAMLPQYMVQKEKSVLTILRKMEVNNYKVDLDVLAMFNFPFQTTFSKNKIICLRWYFRMAYSFVFSII